MFGLALDFDFHSGIAVGGANDFVGNALDLFLDLVELAAHETLDGINRIAGVGDRLTFGGIADQALAGLGKRNDRWRRAFAFGVLQDSRLAALHDRHAGVGRSQINAEYFRHKLLKGCESS